MHVDYYKTLHLTAQQSEQLTAMQGDGARRLVARLVANGDPWPIPEKVTIGIAYTLPDLTEDYYDHMADGTPAAQVIEDRVAVILAPVLMAQAGTAKLSLILRQEGQQIATFPIQLRVQRAAGRVVGENVPAHKDALEGTLYYGGPGGTIIPLKLGPGLEVRDGVLYVRGGGEPEEPVKGATAIMGDDGTIVVSCAAQMNEIGQIALDVPVTLTADGTIMIGGAA